MRRITLALVLLSLPVGVSAGTHRAGAGGGGGGGEQSWLTGLQLNAEYVLGNGGPVTRFDEERWTLSLVGDFTLLSGKHNERPKTQYTLVGGFRGTLNERLPPFGQQFFAHVMGGRYWEVQTGNSAWALVGGIGLDVPLGRARAERPRVSASLQDEPQHEHAEPAVTPVLRFQVDYYGLFSDFESYPQYSVQFILRFH